MAFKTSESLFNAVFGKEKDENLTKQFFKELLQYLDVAAEKEDIEEAQVLAKWIREGRPMRTFACRRDVSDDMDDALIQQGIPFIKVLQVNGAAGFIIKDDDDEAVKDLQAEVLKARAHYCKIVTGEELKEAIGKSREKDKNVLFLSGLKETDAYILKDLCEKELANSQIGIDRMKDGTYTFSFFARKAFDRKQTELNLNAIILMMAMAGHGPNGEKNRLMARNKALFEEAAGVGFKLRGKDLSKTPAWIVGRDNLYIKVSDEGFSYGAAIHKDGSMELREIYSTDAAVPDYEAQLNSYLTRISDPLYTYDQVSAIKYLDSGQGRSTKTVTTKEDKFIAKGEKAIAMAVDGYVSRHMEGEAVMAMDGRWHEKLTHYIEEANNFLVGVQTGQPSDGFTKGEIDDVTEIASGYGLQLPNTDERDSDYDAVTDFLPTLKVSMDQIKIQRIEDVGQQIDSIKTYPSTHKHKTKDLDDKAR